MFAEMYSINKTGKNSGPKGSSSVKISDNQCEKHFNYNFV